MSWDEKLSETERHLWLIKSADKGYSAAYESLGWYYYGKDDYLTALSYFLKCDRILSFNPLPYYYLKGSGWRGTHCGIYKDLRMALKYNKWYHYHGAEPNVLEDIVEMDSIKLVNNACNGDAEAQLLLAKCYNGKINLWGYSFRDDDESKQYLEWLKKSAKNENAEAQYLLAKECSYEDIFEVDKYIQTDSLEYINWLMKSVNQSYVPALIELVRHYSIKDIGNINEIEKLCNEICDKAYTIRDVEPLQSLSSMLRTMPHLYIRLLQKAIELGDISSMLSMGHISENGIGGIKDSKKAFEMFNMALSKAIVEDEFYYRDEAYYELGRCFQNGVGTDRNIDKAIECYKKSSSNLAYQELRKLNVVY